MEENTRHACNSRNLSDVFSCTSVLRASVRSSIVSFLDFPEQFGEFVEREGGDVLDAVGERGGRAAVRHGAALEGARAPDAAAAAGRPGVARCDLRPLKLH